MKSLETFVFFFVFYTKEKNKNVSVRPKLRKPPPSRQDTSALDLIIFFLSQQKPRFQKPHWFWTRGNLKTKPLKPSDDTSLHIIIIILLACKIHIWNSVIKNKQPWTSLPAPPLPSLPCKSHNKLRGTDGSREAGFPAASVLPLKTLPVLVNMSVHTGQGRCPPQTCWPLCRTLSSPLLWLFY